MPKIAVIIPAAGSGKRLGYKTAKPYIKIQSRELLSYCLNVFDKCSCVDQIFIAAEKSQLKKAGALVKKYSIKKIRSIIAGGKTRSDSVYNALKALDCDTDYVLIHDGARPFVTEKLIVRILNEVKKYKAVICAVPCSATIKSADKYLNVQATLDRNKLWQVQTPQAFSYSLILKAYEMFAEEDLGFFDDASLVEKIPHKVKIVPGLNANIKITTAEDIQIAESLIKAGIKE